MLKVYATEARLTVPVIHLTADGQASNDPTVARPLVKVRFSWLRPYATPDGRTHIDGLTEILALIDTGADYSVLSDRYAAGAGPAVEVFDHTALGSVESTTSHDISLYFPPADIITTAGVLLSSAIKRESPFQMILGRHFLKATRFIYDGPAGIRELSFIPQEELDALGVK